MWIRNIIFGFILIGYLRTIEAIEFKDNGYYDVLVTISPDVVADQSDQMLIVKNIQVIQIHRGRSSDLYYKCQD